MARATTGWGVWELAEKAGVTANTVSPSNFAQTQNNQRSMQFDSLLKRLVSSSLMATSLVYE